MSADKNVNVCVVTSPGLLIQIDAGRTSQESAGLRSRRRQHHTSATGRRTRSRHAAGQPVLVL